MIYTVVQNFRYGPLVLLLVLFLISPSEMEARQSLQLKLNHLTTENGLSQSTGLSILQDSEGYMWFGTRNGLNRYNGYDFRIYKNDPTDSTSVSGNYISVLYEDSRGNLWIGTSSSGLNRYNRDMDSFESFLPGGGNPLNLNSPGNQVVSDRISNAAVNDIVEDSLGNLWIGTAFGLNQFDRDTGEFHHFYSDPANPRSLSFNFITTLYEDSRGDLWVGTINGLNRMNTADKSVTRYFYRPGFESGNVESLITAIYEDSNQRLWIGTEDGLHLFDRDTGNITTFRHDENDDTSLSDNIIRSILEDSRGVLWIGTENGGLNALTGSSGEFRFTRFESNINNPFSLPHPAVKVMYESSDQMFWVGTGSGGISYTSLKEPSFEHYKYEPYLEASLSSNSILSFTEADENVILVGTDGGGITLIDTNSGDFYHFMSEEENPASLSSDFVRSLHTDERGDIWIGYYNGGVTRYVPETGDVTHLRAEPGNTDGKLVTDHVFVIYEDTENDHMWFGTDFGGLNRFDTESEEFLPFSDPFLSYLAVRTIYEDSQGIIWIGTEGGGLLQLDKDTTSLLNWFIQGAFGLTSNTVYTIHEDMNGVIWAGTAEDGLFRYDRDNRLFTPVSVDEELFDLSILGILEDSDGNLWLSSDNGLYMFNPAENESVRYGMEHNIQGNEFNTGAYFKDSSGYMYFGGINGFNRFHPDSVSVNMSVSPVVLTDFRVFNEPVVPGPESPLRKQISRAEEIILPWDASVLTFEYVALNYNLNKGEQFSYRLEGFDSDWNSVGNQRTATYTNLSPGEYTFRVRAANADGIWSEADTSIALVITPPFWQTVWFYLFALVVIAGLVAGGYRYRVGSITQQNRRLGIEVARQTGELFEKNSELEKTLNELKKTRGELIEKAHKAGMADLATNVLHNVGNILNSVNVSTTLIDEILTRSRLRNLKKANELLRENQDDLENFILKDPKGKKLLEYYLQLEVAIDKEFEELQVQKNRLTENVNLIIDVVSAQQSYSQAGRLFEKVSLDKLLEDTLTLQAGTIERHGLQIERDYGQVTKIEVEKSKLIHTLINILKNAKEAMEGMDPARKKLVLRTYEEQEHVCISVSDSGVGIGNDQLNKIFNHGFTTKKSGHGFGLHSCANYMQEIGGEIKVESKGEGLGTTIILRFPKTMSVGSVREESRKGSEFLTEE